MLCPTSPSLLRNATSPSRRGLGSQGEVSRFAKGSPTRATTTTAASGENREELLGQRPAGRECKTLHEADAGSRNPDASERMRD